MTTTMAHPDVNSRCAQAALAAPAWAATSRPDRAAALRAIAAGLNRSAAMIINAADTETKLGQPRLRSEPRRNSARILFAELCTPPNGSMATLLHYPLCPFSR